MIILNYHVIMLLWDNQNNIKSEWYHEIMILFCNIIMMTCFHFCSFFQIRFLTGRYAVRRTNLCKVV
jgi:hypothetical protein